jgi:hypothetical protein
MTAFAAHAALALDMSGLRRGAERMRVQEDRERIAVDLQQTGDPVVRQLADRANIFVMNHMKLLESTGLVQYQKLAPAALPAAQDTSQLTIARANAGTAPPLSPAVLWVVLLGTLGLAGGGVHATSPAAHLPLTR